MIKGSAALSRIHCGFMLSRQTSTPAKERSERCLLLSSVWAVHRHAGKAPADKQMFLFTTGAIRFHCTRILFPCPIINSSLSELKLINRNCW